LGQCIQFWGDLGVRGSINHEISGSLHTHPICDREVEAEFSQKKKKKKPFWRREEMGAHNFQESNLINSHMAYVEQHFCPG